MKYHQLSPKVAFALVSFFLGELGDGLNIFQVSYVLLQCCSRNFNCYDVLCTAPTHIYK